MTTQTAPRRFLRAPDSLRMAEHLRATGANVRQLIAEFREARRRTAAPRPSPGPGELVVASWNLHKCVGTDGRFDPHRSVSVIGELGADIVALQEADRRFGRRIGLLDTKLLEKHAGLVPLPVSDLQDGLGWHGNAILVRPGTRARPLRLVAAHFGLLPRCRRRQCTAILTELTEADPMPTVLCGDLNEWNRGHRSSLRGLEPLFGPLTAGPASFPTRMPVLPLDRILAWPQPLVSDIEVHDSPLARIASDHLPLTARLHLAAIAEVFAAERVAA
jgi:endonuclease/exonuclease/phosphatase family metal-dependent hydrolase